MIDEGGHDPEHSFRQRFAVIAVRPQQVGLVKAKKQITALYGFLDAISEMMSLGIQVYAHSEAFCDGSEKADVVAKGGHLNVSGLARAPVITLQCAHDTA